MATTKYTPLQVPIKAPFELRAYLDEQAKRLAPLVNSAAQRDEAETITGDWEFTGTIIIPQTSNVPLLNVANTFSALNTFTNNIDIQGLTIIGLGGAGVPSLAISGDLNTGISGHGGADRLNLITGGVNRHIFRVNDFISLTPIYLQEQAAANGDAAGRGQIWVKNTTPCQLWFTDDAGNDTQIV